jgi:drug/metabolite transporter (DMT)-like permease
MKQQSISQGVGYMVAGGLLLATLGVFLEHAGQHPLTAVLFRCLFGALALGVYATVSGQWSGLRPSWQSIRLSAFTGALMTLMWAAFFAAIQWTSIALATVVFHLQPIWLMLAGVLLLKEKLKSVRAIAILVALIGLALATGLWQRGLPSGQPLFIWGLVMAVLGSVCYAAVSLMAKEQRSISALGLTFWQCISGTALLSWWPTAHGLSEQMPTWTLQTWAWLAGLGALHTGAAYVLIYTGMQRLDASRIAVLQFVYPMGAICLDAWVFGRHLSLSQWSGVLVMGLALWFAGQSRS